jgi:hypothetical protein
MLTWANGERTNATRSSIRVMIGLHEIKMRWLTAFFYPDSYREWAVD